MGDDEPPMIEVLVGDDDPDPDDRGPDHARWHTTIRTVAAVVAAVALLWLGSSVAGMRTTSDEQSCRYEVDNMRWMLEELTQVEGGAAVRSNGRSDLSAADAEELVAMARGCGLDTYADLLERWYADGDDEGDEDRRES